MSIISYLGLFAILLGILLIAIYSHIKVNKLEKYVDELESEMTKYETHTNGAFKGSYFMLKELENKFDTHCHTYEFDDGILYIQEPIYDESNNEVKTVEE